MEREMSAADWVREGFRQLRLAVRWERCARAVDGRLATDLRRQVCEPFLATAWLPGLREVVAELAAAPGDPPWEEAEGRYRSATAGPTLGERDLPARLVAVFRDPSPTLPGVLPEWPSWIAADNVWARQAVALAAWGDLAPQFVVPAEAGERMRTIAAELLVDARRLAKTDPALEARLKSAADLLERYAPPTLPHVAAVADIRVALAEAPSDWPPKVLRDAAREMGLAAIQPGEVAPNLPEPLAARFRLAVGLVTASEGAGWSDPRAWAVAHAACRRLFDRIGLTLRFVRVINEADTGYVTVPVSGLSEPRVAITGVGYERPDASGGVAWVRKPVVECPPPQPLLPGALRSAAFALSRTDPDFAALCEVAATRVPTADGWARLGDEDRELWWRVVQRARLHPKDAISLLHELAAVGVTPVPVKTEDPTDGPWFVVPGDRVSRGGPACGVRFPDGRILGPSVWLAFAPPDHPLGRALAECEPLLTRLRHADPRWDGWEAYRETVWRWAVSGTGEPDIPAVTAAFEAAYRRSREGGPFADRYHDLAARLYRCLSGNLGVVVIPQLDPITLAAQPIRALPDDGTEVEWDERAGSPGEVLEVLRFGAPGRLARLRIGVGSVGTRLLPWLKLPPPPAGPLSDWRRALPGLLLRSDGVAAEIDRHRRLVVDWLVGAGAGWLAGAVSTNDPWLTALLGSKWCRLFPEVGPDGVHWPEGITGGPEVAWEFDERVHFRRLIRGARYSVAPERAGGVFSLGGRGDAPALAAAMDLARTAPDARAALDIRDRELSARNDGRAFPPADLERLALALVDWLAGAESAVPAARAWLAARGLTLLPSGPPDGAGLTPEFGSRPRGPWVARYGLRSGDQTRRPPQSRLSAGPPPHGYPALAAAVARAAKAHPGLGDALANWPAEAVAERLDAAAADLHVLAWEARQRDPSAAVAAVTDALAVVLREQWGIVPWVPETFADARDGWAQASGPMRTGAVTAVLRPGLVSADFELVTPALIHVD